MCSIKVLISYFTYSLVFDYFGETRIKKHNSTVGVHDTDSHNWAHMPKMGHAIDFKKAKVQTQAKSKGSRLTQKASFSGPNALNRSIQFLP